MASRLGVEVRRNLREPLLVVRLAPDAAPLGQHVAEILRQPLVDPEEIADHRLLKVRRGETGGRAELSVPRVGVLVCCDAYRVLLGERVFVYARAVSLVI